MFVFRFCAKVPVYVFGNTKLLKRLELPAWVEAASLALRTSLVLCWGRFGLPIPFQVPIFLACAWSGAQFVILAHCLKRSAPMAS